MPKTKFQAVIFTLMMVMVMVYPMICFNISLEIGKMTNQIFLMAFRELVVMAPIAFLIEMFVVEKLAQMLAFRIVKPDDRPIFIILAISTMIVCLMCPIMSFIATFLYKDAGVEFLAVWLQTTTINFFMALFLQIFVAGPLVRNMFRMLFKKSLSSNNNKQAIVN